MKKLRWYVSPLLIVMMIVLIACGYFYDCLIYFTTIVLHELAHAEVSMRLGYALDRFVLMPYGASLKGEFEGVRARDEIIIALAGPVFNASLAVLCAAMWWILPSSYAFTDRLAAANIFTAVFNLLPVFPLDGGRIALAALGTKIPRNKAYKAVRITGFIFAPIFAALFVLVFVFTDVVNFSFAFISVFIFFSTIFRDKNSTYRRIYGMAFFSERLKRGLKINHIMVPFDNSLIQLDRMLNAGYYTIFTVVDENFQYVCQISENELNDLLAKNSPTMTLKDINQKSAQNKSGLYKL